MERDGLIPRTARKAWTCEGDGSASHRHADDCPHTIAPGQRYVECLWEAPAYASGTRVSMPCAVAFYGWTDDGSPQG